MKKKLLSFILLVCLIATLVPNGVFAADPVQENRTPQELADLGGKPMDGAAHLDGSLDRMGIDMEPIRSLSGALDNSGWDGVSMAQPEGDGTEENPYQISTGDQLYWLSDFINQSSGNAALAHAVLTDDIDLGGYEWTPIGNSYSAQYSSVFDGNGHIIEGLKIESTGDCGLFGNVNKAVVRNLTVAGEIKGTGDYAKVGGLCASVNQGTFENCASLVSITATSNFVGGLIGIDQGTGKTQIRNCYNAGSVESSGTGNVGGLLGKSTASGAITAENCYNAGTVSAPNGIACGLFGELAFRSTVSNCYNIGAVTGKTTHALFKKDSSVTLTNSYYLATSVASTGDGAVSKTAEELKTAVFVETLGTENWKADESGRTNGGYPVLSWQTIVPSDQPGLIPLDVPANVRWELDADGSMTKTVAWDAVENASSYTVKLYNYAGSIGLAVAVAEINGVTNTNYDFTETFETLPNDWYYVTVQAHGDSEIYESSDASAFNYAQRYIFVEHPLEVPTGLVWQASSAVARWESAEFAAYYTVSLYKNGTPIWTGATAENSVDLSALIFSEGDYTYTIVAHPDTWDGTNPTPQDSPQSAHSSIYHYPPSSEEPDEGDWIAVSSAKQLIDLANVKDEPSEEDVTVSKQEIEWSKNYKVVCDIDFSGLSSIDAAKTKTIGSAIHKFGGIFDGGGHKITGLTLSNGDSGLFGYIAPDGKVRNLTIEGANVLFSDNAAVLCWVNYGRIENCAVINCKITADTGAIIGGLLSRNYGTVTTSYVLGGVLKSNADLATGHAGFVGGNYGTIKQCYSTMNVETQSMYAGGFAGWSDNGGSFEDCFALGDVSAREYSGGFIGRINDSATSIRNCYTSNTVTVTKTNGDGFIGALGSEGMEGGAFHPEYPDGAFASCYFNSEKTAADRFATAKQQAELISAEMLETLGSDIWTQASDENNGLPYLKDVAPPKNLDATNITVQIAVATYNKESYAFEQLGEPVSVTLAGTGNIRVVDVLDAAQEQGLLAYSYETTADFGRYIHTINGHEVQKPDGWMFMIDDKLSNVSASLAAVPDGAKILWYEGTPENRYQGPKWETLMGGSAEDWTTIQTADELRALFNLQDAAALAKNYRLAQDIDLEGAEIQGIGSLQHPFTGMFDGQGHTVSNFVQNGSKNVGLFNVICGATVKNLNVEGAVITAAENVGILVGYSMAALDENELGKSRANLVGNCHVTGSVTAEKRGGGLVGYNEGKYDSETLFSIYSTIHDSSADVPVTGSGNSSSMLGGLVGENRGYVRSSSASGDVEGVAMVGGLAGSNGMGIYDSHASGTVTGTNGAGGFVGTSDAETVIENSYSLGNVIGQATTGGNIGGFAGSIAGKVKFCMSAGSVTPGFDYSGGFAGRFSGYLTGAQNQISLIDSYGNCAGPDGKELKPIGNTSAFPGDGNLEAMQAVALSSMPQVCDKLYEMFGINLELPDFVAEAAKYEDSVVVPYGAQGALSFLKEGETADVSVLVSYEVEEGNGYLEASGNIVTLTAQNDTKRPVTLAVTLMLSGDAGAHRKEIAVVLKPDDGTSGTLIENIAKGYPDNSGEWVLFDLALYAGLEPETAVVSTEKAVQNYLNLVIKALEKTDASAGDRAKAEIILRAIGIDSTRLYPVNSNEPFDNAKRLSTMEAPSYYDAPWMLIAAQQGNINFTVEQVQKLVNMLRDNQPEGGVYGYEWDGVFYTDPDTTAIALSALAPLALAEDDVYGVKEMAQAIIDKAVAGLSTLQDQQGSFGSANSDAMAVIGLAALGINPASDPRFVKDGISLMDGLLSYANETNDGFLFFGEANALATEQAFRALITEKLFGNNNGKALHVYDFSSSVVQPGRATGEGEIVRPSDPDTDKTINVTLTIKTDTQTWVPKSTISVKEGSSVYHALTKALQQHNMTCVGAENGYVKSMTKGGVTLGEFDKGENSGWLYQVNGDTPKKGLTDYKLSAGDDILWVYTTDWVEDPNSGGISGGGTSDTTTSVITLPASVKDGQATGSATFSQVKDAAKKATNSVTIRLETKQDVQKHTISLDQASIKELAKYSGISLRYETGLGTITLSTEGLRELAATSGSNFALTLEKDGTAVLITLLVDKKTLQKVNGGLHAELAAPVGDVVATIDGDITNILEKSAIKDKKAHFMLEGSAKVVVLENAKAFDDVLESAWFYDSVNFVSSHTLFQGISDTKFAPDDAMTRAMLVTVLHRLEHSPAFGGDASSVFSDVPAGAYYERAVRWASEKEIISGISQDLYGPDLNITREQLVTMLYRYADSLGLSLSEKGDVSKYLDGNTVSAWAKEAMQWAVGAGLVSGRENGLIDPQGKATRAEVAAIFQRFVETLYH